MNGAMEAGAPLLEKLHSDVEATYIKNEEGIVDRVWVESKKLWQIVGPAIFSRVVSYTMFVITQAFAGHLGDLELAAFSIASNVIVGLDFGLLLGMASALETLCGQAYGAKKYRIVRVANELGAGNGKGAKFATIVVVMTSAVIGLFFMTLIIILHDKLAFIFSNSEEVVTAVNKLSILLAFTILLNSVQPVLSGVAVGSGWQSSVAYINLGCYYLIGVPLGFLMGWGFNQGVKGIWAGMIFGGTAVQTLILCIITIRCDWDKEAEKTRMHVKKWAETIQETTT